MFEVGSEIHFCFVLRYNRVYLSIYIRRKWFTVLFIFWPFEILFYFLHLFGFFSQTRYHLNAFRLTRRFEFSWLPWFLLLNGFFPGLFKRILPVVFIIEIDSKLFYWIENLLMKRSQFFLREIILFILAIRSSLAKAITFMTLLLFFALFGTGLPLFDWLYHFSCSLR